MACVWYSIHSADALVNKVVCVWYVIMSFAVRDGHWALLHVCLSHADCFWALLHVCLSYANCSWGLLHVCLSQKQKVANSSYLVHWLCKWSQHFQIEFVNWWSYSLPTWQLFDRKCHMLRTYRFKGHRQKLNRMSAYWSWLMYLRMKTFEKLQKVHLCGRFSAACLPVDSISRSRGQRSRS